MAAALLVVGAAGLTTGSAAPAQLCVVGGTKMPGGVDAWPKNPLPDVWIKITLGRKEHDATAFCRTPRIDNADSPMWNHCCALPPLGSTQARIGGTYFIYAWDGDVANEEGDLLGVATLDYASPPGQFLLQLDGGKSHGEATVELIISAQPSPPPPPLAVPPSPPAPPPILKQVCVLAAAGLPAHYDALSEEGGLPLHYLMHKGLDASAPFHRAPEPWVKVVAGPSKDDPQAYKEWWDAIGSFPGHAQMIEKVDGFGHFVPIVDKSATTLAQCRTPLHLNEVSPRWGWCCDFTGMAAGVDYVFQLFDEDAYMGYSQDDFLGYATLAGDAGAGTYELELQGGAFAPLGGSKADGVLKVEIVLGASQPVYANFGIDCWDQCAETGPCPSFCGPKGACCRDGYDGLGCPQLDAACGGERHCCTTSVPLPPPSAPPPAPDEVIHTDEYCLDACGGKEGPCDFCGVNGACCMDGELVEGCPAAGGGAPFGTYGCVEIPAVTIVAFLREDPTQHRRLLTRHWPAAAALAAATGALLAAGAHRLRRRAVATPPADGESAQML